MINRIFRLTAARKIEIAERELRMDADRLIIQPKYLSICAADQRYYLGRRKPEILREKLPMALIHEAIGQIVHDPIGERKPGEWVVLVPVVSSSNVQSSVKDNYNQNNGFQSSTEDGFLQDLIALDRARALPLPSSNPVYVLTELLSVAFNAVEGMKKLPDYGNGARLGVWGDGSVGFVVALVLRHKYPCAHISVFGKHQKKLQYFAFVDATYVVDKIPQNTEFDQCYECVGETGAHLALAQILEYIKPQSDVGLLGVCEEPIFLHTRKVLEKGLRLVGHSRSAASDFMLALDFLHSNANFREYMFTIISNIFKVRCLEDIHRAFEEDLMNDFKTVMKLEI